MYYNKFFKNKEEAKAFQKEQGYGALYSNEKGSRTRSSYAAEAAMTERSVDFCKAHPFVVAWNG